VARCAARRGSRPTTRGACSRSSGGTARRATSAGRAHSYRTGRPRPLEDLVAHGLLPQSPNATTGLAWPGVDLPDFAEQARWRATSAVPKRAGPGDLDPEAARSAKCARAPRAISRRPPIVSRVPIVQFAFRRSPSRRSSSSMASRTGRPMCAIQVTSRTVRRCDVGSGTREIPAAASCRASPRGHRSRGTTRGEPRPQERLRPNVDAGKYRNTYLEGRTKMGTSGAIGVAEAGTAGPARGHPPARRCAQAAGTIRRACDAGTSSPAAVPAAARAATPDRAKRTRAGGSPDAPKSYRPRCRSGCRPAMITSTAAGGVRRIVGRDRSDRRCVPCDGVRLPSDHARVDRA